MKQDNRDPIVLTGYTYVIGALADIFHQRELVAGRAKTGDMKLWCQSGQRVWQGQFRSAVFDGKKWRTFRLNIVAADDARYDTLDNRTVKARRVFAVLAQLKNQTARLREGTYGCTFTLKADAPAAAKPVSTTAATPAPAPAKPVSTTVATPAPAPAKPVNATVATPAPASVRETTSDTTTPVAQTAARTSQAPALGTGTKSKVQVTGRKRKRRRDNPDQLTLF